MARRGWEARSFVVAPDKVVVQVQVAAPDKAAAVVLVALSDKVVVRAQAAVPGRVAAVGLAANLDTESA